jgi:hypothetical protein
MDNPEKTKGFCREWTTLRKPKGQSRMDNPEKTKRAIKNGQPRENQRVLSGMDKPEKTKGYCPEWTNQRKPKGQSRMDNQEKNQKGNQEWTTQRKPKDVVGNGQHRGKPKGVVGNGQSRGTYTIGNMAQIEDKEDKKQTTLKTNRMSNVDTTLNWRGI